MREPIFQEKGSKEVIVEGSEIVVASTIAITVIGISVCYLSVIDSVVPLDWFCVV